MKEKEFNSMLSQQHKKAKSMLLEREKN